MVKLLNVPTLAGDLAVENTFLIPILLRIYPTYNGIDGINVYEVI